MCSGRSISSRPSRASGLRRGLCIACLALLTFPALVHAQGLALDPNPGKGYGVEVRALSATQQQAQPGQILSLSFRVISSSAEAEEFIEALELPQGWQSLLPEASFTLGPGQATTRLALLRVPTAVASGSYEIAYVARSQRDYGIQDRARITVEVAGVSKLALLLESKPDMVVGGGSCAITARAVNGGNASLPVTVVVTGNERDTIAVEPQQFVLPAGANQVITVTVKTPKTQERPEQRAVQITVTSTDAGGEPISASVTAAFKVIARLTTAPDLKHRIPATLTFRFSGEGGEGGVQAELAGRGALDDRGTRHIDFLLRGPDTQDKGIFGWRDEYWLNYTSPSLDARLGDQSYGLSPLTSYFRYGRGLGVIFRPGTDATAVGAYFLRSRWGDDSQELGAHAQHRVSPALGLKLNFLHSSAERASVGVVGATESARANLVSIEGAYTPNDSLRVNFEYARGSYSPENGERVSDGAYRVEARGAFGNGIYYFLQKTHAGPDYYGYYHDADYTSGSVSLPFGSRLKANLSFSDWRQNLELRPYQDTAPRERLVSAGLSYAFPRNWSAELQLDHYRREDALAPAEYDYTERPLRLAVAHSTESHSLRLETVHSKRTDGLSGLAQTVQEYRLSAYYRPSTVYTIGLYGALSTADTVPGAFFVGGNDNLGFSFDWRPSEELSAGASYLKYGFGDRGVAAGVVGSGASQWEVYGRYLLSEQRALNLRIRGTESRIGGSSTSWMLSYAVPLGLPVGTRTAVGGVRGRIVDIENPTGAGRAEVILSCANATAISDAQGQFFFPALPAGMHTLDIDRGSLGVDVVTREKLPMTVNVTGGETTTVEIAVTRAGSITGVVRLVAAPAADGAADGAEPSKYVIGNVQNTNAKGADSPGGGIANLLVEASSDDECVRTITNARGEFAFRGLRPGSWTVKTDDEGLPEQHYLERSEQLVGLAAGQTAQVSFNVLPRLRRIRLIDSGTLGSP